MCCVLQHIHKSLNTLFNKGLMKDPSRQGDLNKMIFDKGVDKESNIIHIQFNSIHVDYIVDSWS